jgi:prevent-host-death family protein
MATYSVATTKDRLSALIDRAQAGEEVLITKRGKPAVRLVAAHGRGVHNRSVATELLRQRLAGLAEVRVPVNRFSDWLYDDSDR